MKSRVTLLNMATGLLLQFFTTVSGFILPRLILGYFGSEANGLVASLNQFLSYITLVEGGITGVVVASLYKPLVSNDQGQISSIYRTAKKFFFKIGLLFALYTIVLAVAYPLVFHLEFSFLYVFSLTLILSLNFEIQYMFSLSLRTLLQADKKGYVISLSQVVVVILNVILAYVSLKIWPNIHLMKFISGILFVIPPFVFSHYVKKHYALDRNAKPDNSLIQNRWNGFAINFAAFIHGSTDISILTIFTNLQLVSVYSVHALVANGLKQLVNAALTGIAATVGHAYAKGEQKELNDKMDIYEFIVFFLVFFCFTLGILLITPFVQLYTAKLEDAAAYRQPLFGILLLVSEMIYLVKLPHLNLAYSANRFKEITTPAFIEAFLNIGVSIALVGHFGLLGVAIGTIAGMTYRLVFHVHYTTKLIPGRRQCIFYRKLLVFLLPSLLVALFCFFVIPFGKLTVFSWLWHAVLYACILGVALLAVSGVFFKKELKFFAHYIGK